MERENIKIGDRTTKIVGEICQSTTKPDLFYQLLWYFHIHYCKGKSEEVCTGEK